MVTTAIALTATMALTVVADASTAGSRVVGAPTSSNGASSFHIRPAERMPATDDVSVELEVRQPPTGVDIWFWALQVDFVDASGTRVAGAHLGLQWHPAHPGRTAMNFGGYRYDATGGAIELPGQNTFDFAWEAETPYRLRIFRDGDGWWSGEITDLHTDTATLVRRLHAGGAAMVKPIVWTESFASCDAPRTAVRWSSMSPAPTSYRVSYQSYDDGGCTNTSTTLTANGLVQRTNVERTTPDWSVLPGA